MYVCIYICINIYSCLLARVKHVLQVLVQPHHVCINVHTALSPQDLQPENVSLCMYNVHVCMYVCKYCARSTIS